MDVELKALHSNCTWVLVPRPENVNIVGLKWVFRRKYLADGSIDRYKARLVAWGFTQILGFNFTHTFSPIVKALTVRVVLSLIVMNNWLLCQLDMYNAFLHGLLDKPAYMEQPPGFTNLKFPVHVCLLQKAVYGLKQACLAWFHRFSSFLLTLRFTCSTTDTFLFIFHKGSPTLYLLLYVDDIIIRGNVPSSVGNLVTRIRQEFAIKDLGRLTYFLGLEVHYTDHVKHTLDHGLTFERGKSEFLGYLNVDWAHCLKTCRSTYDYSIFIGPNLISWSAKKQSTMTRFSCESEYRVLANAAAEVI